MLIFGKIKFTNANSVMLQPQATPMSYHLDGVVEAVCGFVIAEEEQVVLSFNSIVTWATGRVVVQEIRI